MKAEIEIECREPETVIKSISPEIDAKKFDAKLEESGDKLTLTIESEDMTGLLAGINSYMKLIRTAINIEEIYNGWNKNNPRSPAGPDGLAGMPAADADCIDPEGEPEHTGNGD
jgi:tRNA threonylcarbamoyladenosine modification (KEOPS) complex  Pcc1 subunit